jgi:signal transduction histidine kinase
MRSFPVRDEEGHVIRIIEHLQDMTETLRLQDEAARSAHLASLGELAAGVAHEINNPINGIINYAQLLGERLAASEREADMAGRIIREGERIATIVRNLLSFARKRPEEKAPVAICEVLLDAYVLAEAQLRRDGIEVVLDLPEHLPEIVAHGQQLQQVFLNLISNARYALNEKYPGRAPGKTLAISVGRFEYAGQPRLNMTFRDQGTGIPAGIRDKVLNPFFTTKPSGAGTGLGLSISHGILADHGGALRIESQPGAWTCVTVDLPLETTPSAIQDFQP